MAGTMTSVAAALAYRKNAKKKQEQPEQPDYDKLLSGLPAGVVNQAVAEKNQADQSEEEKKKKRAAAQRTILGGGYSANADKVLSQIKGN
jgi:hypothetical protein